MRKVSWLGLVSVLCAGPAWGIDSVRLVKDIQDGAIADSVGSQFCEYNGLAYFACDAPGTGSALWVTDGTAGGTHPVPLTRGVRFADGPSLLRSTILFRADIEGKGTELGGYDPDSQTTRLIKDISPGPGGSYPNSLIRAGGLCYFLATRPDTGYEFWRTDGTEAGTWLVGDLNPGPTSTSYFFATMVPLGNRLIAFVNDGAGHGTEPCMIDGVSGGAYLLRDVVPGSGSYNPAYSQFRPLGVGIGTHVLFIAGSSSQPYEVWVSDGTPEGTVPLTHPPATGTTSPRSLVSVGERAYFIARTGTSTVDQLLSSNGTPEGTFVVDLGSGAPPASAITSMVEFGGELGITVSSNHNWRGFWLSDLTPANTRLISVEALGGRPFENQPPGLTYFVSSTSATGSELWVSDHTAAGTHLAADVLPGPESAFTGVYFILPGGVLGFASARLGDSLVFAPPKGPLGREPWISDGTPSGTRMLGNLAPEDGAQPGWTTPVGANVFYVASTAATGMELWFSDGTSAGTHLTRDIRPGSSDGVTYRGLAIGEQLLFDANDGITGSEPWHSDGTEPGTNLVADLQTGQTSSSPIFLGSSQNTAIFRASSDAGRGIFASDGFSVDRLIQIPSFFSSGDYWLAPDGGALQGHIFLSSSAGGTGWELWMGSIETGELGQLVDIAAGPDDSSPSGFAYFNGLVVFSATDPQHGREPWLTDGTASGTVRLADIAPGAGDSSPAGFKSFGDGLLFFARDGIHGLEPWFSDGTAGGTRLLRDIYPGPLDCTAYSDFTLVNDVAIFNAGTPEHGAELWATDGTPEGTGLLRDIQPGPISSNPTGFVKLGGFAYFQAWDEFAGEELWRTDGTPQGTVRVADIWPGPDSGVQYLSAAAAGEGLYFAANDGVHGQELWLLMPEASTDVNGDGQVDLQDLAILLSSFGSCAGSDRYSAAVDLNGSLCIDLLDLAALLADFGG